MVVLTKSILQIVHKKVCSLILEWGLRLSALMLRMPTRFFVYYMLASNPKNGPISNVLTLADQEMPSSWAPLHYAIHLIDMKRVLNP